MPPSHPFSAEFLTREWPLLREACSFPRDPAKIAALASEVNDVDSLFQLAEEHGVIALLATAVADTSRLTFSPEFLEKLTARRRMQSVFALAMSAELFRILEMLRSAGIDTVVVKGPVLSFRAYGDSAIRRYADVDMLVRHAEVARVVEVLTNEGYQSKVPQSAVRSGKIPGEYVFRSPGSQLLFEFHTERTLRYFPRGLPIDECLARETAVPIQIVLRDQPVFGGAPGNHRGDPGAARER